jgi:hypothetical protein
MWIVGGSYVVGWAGGSWRVARTCVLKVGIMCLCFFQRMCENRVSKALYFSREPRKPLFRGNPRRRPT